MKSKSAILIISLAITAFFLANTGSIINSSNEKTPIYTASLFNLPSMSDTSDLNIEDYKKEITRLKEKIKSLKENKFKFHFDSEEFKDHMKNLKFELGKIKTEDFHFEFDFDSEEFRENMKELCIELNDHKLALHDFDFDMEEFNEEMAELSEELKHMDFDIDINMDELEIDMSNLKEELKKLEDFMDDLKSELKNDGFIEDVDEDVDLLLDEDKMEVNGEEVSDELHQKYLDLYEENFNKSLDDSFRIHSH